MTKSINTNKKVTAKINKTNDEKLLELKQHFVKNTDAVNADKSAVIRYFLSIDNKEILKTIALLDYSQISTWELINANLAIKESSDDYIVSEDDNIAIAIKDSLVDTLLSQLPTISLDQTNIMSDKLLKHDLIVALDGIYIADTVKTKVGLIKVSYGIGNIIIPLPDSSNKALLIGTVSNIANSNGNCFTASNDELDKQLLSSLSNQKTANIYKLARTIAISTWDYETRFMTQVNKVKKAQIERNSRSDFYQQLTRLGK
jgi:hypothetical protein